MTREQAGERFWTVWALGWVVGLLHRWLDPPQWVGIALTAVWVPAAAWFGLAWLSKSVREGRVRRRRRLG